MPLDEIGRVTPGLRRIARFLPGLLLIALASCSSLPKAGPSSGQVAERFDPKQPNPLGVRLLQLTPTVLQAVRDTPRPSLRLIDGLRAYRPLDLIGPGDVLSVSIYESGPGLFNQQRAPAEGTNATGVGTPGTSSETLPRLQVNRAGRITVPYAGDVMVAGHTPTEVQHILEDRLAGKASQPQVLVSIVTNDTNVVFVSGDVRSSGRFPLTLSGETLLDMISLAGGPTHSAQDSLVRVTRHGQQAQTTLNAVQNSPAENIPIQPQDRIQVDYEPRTYLVFGATGKVAQIPFDQAHLSLAEAVARTGGLDDQRADPTALFLFRFENPVVARAEGLPAEQRPVPVIYRVDMSDPQSYFLVQELEMRDKDLLYIANARTVQIYKFLQLIDSLFTPVFTAGALANY